MQRKFCPRKFSFFCWQSLAVVLVLFALTVSLIRGLLPQLDEAKHQLVNYIEDNYQIEVKVGKLAAEWQAFGPAITIDELVLPPQENLPITLVIEQVHVKLDFWETLLALSPQVENVMFSGAKIALDLDKLKLVADTDDTSEASMDWLYSLLLEQLDRYAIRDVDIQLVSSKSQFRPIHITDLKWLNRQGQHKGKGFVHLDNSSTVTEQLSLRVDLSGDGHQADSLVGQLYLQAQSLDLGEWASRQPNPYNPEKSLPLEGVVNLEAWFDVKESRFESGLVLFESTWLEWLLNEQPQRFAIDSGAISWQPNDKGWQVHSQDLQFSTNGEQWPDLDFQFAQQSGVTFGYVNQFDPYLLLPLLPLIPGVELAQLELWQAMEPSGLIGPVRLHASPNGPVQAEAKLSDITWLANKSIPGSKAVDFSVGWQGSELFIDAPEQPYTLDFNGGFKDPLRLDGEAFQARFDFDDMSLDIPKLSMSNDDLALDASARILFTPELHLALSADVDIKNAGNADKYYPLHGMSESLVSYLKGALKAGKTNDAKVVWHGPLNRYPYDNHDGVFQAGFNLTDAQYEFHPDWPAVDDISLYALFENARMDLWVDKGQLLDIAADGAHVFIPEIGLRTQVKVQADLRTNGQAATSVLQQSQLKETVGKTLDVVQVNGPIRGILDLTIPLYEQDEPDIRGKIHFKDNPIFISQPGILLEEVSGEIEFANEVVTGSGVKAKLYQQPAVIAFDTAKANQDFALNLAVNSQWQLNKLPDSLKNPLQGFYSGNLDWNGTMTMIFDDTGYRLQAQVTSDLLGTELSLPQHYAKKSNAKRPLRVELIGDNKQSSLGVKYGGLAEFWGNFNFDKSNRLEYFDLQLGRLFELGDQLQKRDGHIHLAMAETDLIPWVDVMKTFVEDSDSAAPTTNSDQESKASKNDRGFFPPLQGIAGRIKQLSIAGEQLDDLSVNMYPAGSLWRVDAHSTQFAGSIDFYPSWREQGLKVVAERLYMSNDMAIPGKETLIPDEVMAMLPPLAVEVKDFRFNDLILGELVLQAGAEANDYKIQTVSLTTPETKMIGNGVWKNQHGENQTQLDFTINSNNFDSLAQQLGLNAGLTADALEVKAKLDWPAAPYGFAVAQLNGKVNFEFGKGVLTEVSDKGARIFSLFSLDSLLRKLSLDFRDVFGKGLYFTSFGGNLDIDHGVVKTTDTQVSAVAGDMKVRGFTDLTTESLNYDIRFIPQLASSVPTVVLLSTSGWTLGLGAFALTKVLEPVIEVISEIRFRLTGTMDDPKLEELERKSKEIEIPESVLPKTVKEIKTKSIKESIDEDNIPNALPVDEDTIVPGKSPSDSEHSGHAIDGLDPDSQPIMVQPNSGKAVPLSALNNRLMHQSIEQGVVNADQYFTMPKQPRCRVEPRLYRIAA